MREPSDATIDRLGDDIARLEAEADAVWAVLDAAGIDVQLGVDTLADGVQMLVAVRDMAIASAEQSDRGRRLNAIAAQLGGVSWDTIPEAIVSVLNARDEAIIDRDNYAAAFRAITAALLPFTVGGPDV